MIEGSLLTIIPPVVASVLTYIVANKRSKLNQIKIITDIQTRAIEMVQQSGEQLRLELKKEIDRINTNNLDLTKRIELLDNQCKMLDNQCKISDQLVVVLKQEIISLRETTDHYKQLYEENRIIIDTSKKEIEYLQHLASENGIKFRKKIKE